MIRLFPVNSGSRLYLLIGGFLTKVFVSGGAGYIGSHVVKALGEKGFSVLVYDNLSKGYRDAVLQGRLVVGDLADIGLMDTVINEFKPDAAMHFAAFIEVGESVLDPIKYYLNNVANTINLLYVLGRHKINHFIFSSSAAVYGNPLTVPIPESESIKPINPYGQSKAIVEAVLRDMSSSFDFHHISLRYFNAAGADSLARIGERHNPESHLIPLILKAAKGVREHIQVYGTDYATSDGTCIRDYIHVEDLAEAHILALEYLVDGGKSDYLNCGYGHGYSVREVIDAARRVTGVQFAVRDAERRPGDPAVLISDNTKIRQLFQWIPKYDDLQYIVKTAWEWERKLRE